MANRKIFVCNGSTKTRVVLMKKVVANVSPLPDKSCSYGQWLTSLVAIFAVSACAIERMDRPTLETLSENCGEVSSYSDWVIAREAGGVERCVPQFQYFVQSLSENYNFVVAETLVKLVTTDNYYPLLGLSDSRCDLYHALHHSASNERGSAKLIAEYTTLMNSLISSEEEVVSDGRPNGEVIFQDELCRSIEYVRLQTDGN